MNRFKKLIKKLWYKLISKEYKIGWVETGPHIVILNNEFIHNIELTSESEIV